nr:MAG TPA: hypothetical protein [Caudoviricetes sp.]
MITFQHFSDYLTNVVFDNFSIRFVLNEFLSFVIVKSSLDLYFFQHHDTIVLTAFSLYPKVVSGFCKRAVCKQFCLACTLVWRIEAVVCTIYKLTCSDILNRIHSHYLPR